MTLLDLIGGHSRLNRRSRDPQLRAQRCAGALFCWRECGWTFIACAYWRFWL